MERSTWVEVSRAALRANFESAARHVRVPVCAVVKANAYGHGMTECARVFASAGAALLGVTRLEEAADLRAAGIAAPILVFTPVADWKEAVALGCEVTVASAADAVQLPAGARAHLKVDTGMGRLGVSPADAAAVAEDIGARATLAGIWTHLADAAGPSGGAQLDRFRAAVAALRHNGIVAPTHALNSAGVLAHPDAGFDMVRIGTLLYGQDPPGVRAPWAHNGTFSWFARVASVRTLQPGATTGYGSEWKARAPTRVATIPIGFADGFGVEPHARTPSAKETLRALKHAVRPGRVVRFGERDAPVIGRVGMQMITVSLAGIDGVEVGDVAEIPARRLMVSPQIERVYA